MRRISLHVGRVVVGGFATVLVLAVPQHAAAQTGACGGLSGAQLALCLSYCEVQNCDQMPSGASCPSLRSAWHQQTGKDAFPCDCGDGVVQLGEGCDPPGGQCPNAGAGFTCTATCQCACPKFVDFVGTPGSVGLLDTGWTGQGHDSTLVDAGKVTVGVTSCAGANRPCGVCNVLGPVDNLNAATYPSAAGPSKDINNRRCTNNTSVVCSSNAACFRQCVGGANDGAACAAASGCPSGTCGSSAGTCEYYFGSYLPLAAGGVSTCVGNQIAGVITGTANVESGGAATNVSLRSIVYSGPTLAQPCPQCQGDGNANDGARGGTCAGGMRDTKACDVNGTSPNAAWGATSLDCPPLSGGQIAALSIDLSNTTGTKARTVSASNPLCSAVGFTSNRCQCDTCNNAAATPCSTNADCTAVGASVCGGKRCIGGTNSAAVCTVASQCPGGACSTPGAKTAPNQCDAGSGDCVAGDNSPATSANDHICQTGPFEQFCGPVETFRGCISDTDCTRPGDTCSVGRFRECFDNGLVGDVVTATGVVDTPVADESDPTLAALFCAGPTASSSVNGAAGLPGLGRLELPGHARAYP